MAFISIKVLKDVVGILESAILKRSKSRRFFKAKWSLRPEYTKNKFDRFEPWVALPSGFSAVRVGPSYFCSQVSSFSTIIANIWVSNMIGGCLMMPEGYCGRLWAQPLFVVTSPTMLKQRSPRHRDYLPLTNMCCAISNSNPWLPYCCVIISSLDYQKPILNHEKTVVISCSHSFWFLRIKCDLN